MSQPNPEVLALVREINDYKEAHPDWGVLGAVAGWCGIDNQWEQVCNILLPGDPEGSVVVLQLRKGPWGYSLSDHSFGVGLSKTLAGIPDLH